MREGELGYMHSDLSSIDPRPRYNVTTGSIQKTPMKEIYEGQLTATGY